MIGADWTLLNDAAFKRTSSSSRVVTDIVFGLIKPKSVSGSTMSDGATVFHAHHSSVGTTDVFVCRAGGADSNAAKFTCSIFIPIGKRAAEAKVTSRFFGNGSVARFDFSNPPPRRRSRSPDEAGVAKLLLVRGGVGVTSKYAQNCSGCGECHHVDFDARRMLETHFAAIPAPRTIVVT